jgi:hypothetical protein
VKRLGLASAGYRSSHKCRVSWFTVLHLSSLSLVHLGGDEAKSIFVELGVSPPWRSRHPCSGQSKLAQTIAPSSSPSSSPPTMAPPAGTGDCMCVYYACVSTISRATYYAPALLLTHALFSSQGSHARVSLFALHHTAFRNTVRFQPALVPLAIFLTVPTSFAFAL